VTKIFWKNLEKCAEIVVDDHRGGVWKSKRSDGGGNRKTPANWGNKTTSSAAPWDANSGEK
jgi:hypothetical protein